MRLPAGWEVKLGTGYSIKDTGCKMLIGDAEFGGDAECALRVKGYGLRLVFQTPYVLNTKC